MNGMHRVCKVFIEAQETILAVRFTELHDPDNSGNCLMTYRTETRITLLSQVWRSRSARHFKGRYGKLLVQ